MNIILDHYITKYFIKKSNKNNLNENHSFNSISSPFFRHDLIIIVKIAPQNFKYYNINKYNLFFIFLFQTSTSKMK